jgi:hypothetical protein
LKDDRPITFYLTQGWQDKTNRPCQPAVDFERQMLNLKHSKAFCPIPSSVNPAISDRHQIIT